MDPLGEFPVLVVEYTAKSRYLEDERKDTASRDKLVILFLDPHTKYHGPSGSF